MIENIKKPEDIKNLSPKQQKDLCAEIRDKIISTVSANGGHLASNLGFVETTLVLHKMFDVPNDKIIFDVGHQCYAHKILTGRYDRFDTLRKECGISGFTNRFESEYDTLTAGHSGSSISASLGIASANAIQGVDNYTVCVVGDGSFTNGMIYEALNNCDNKNIRLIIILNDNEMSISHNVGSLANYLSKIRTSGKYYRLKRGFQAVFIKIPIVGKPVINFFRHIKNALKRIFYKQPFFAALGVRYLGPVDGNDIERLETVISEAKKYNTCTLVHIKTKKGFGYELAENEPEHYHSVGAFDLSSGVNAQSGNDFSSEFGKILTQMASENDKICAITSAMTEGTGLLEFAKKFPDRFFDVGIAEEHEIAFAGGLNVKGLNPVCALYSTFAQRTFDQIIHDLSLQRLHAVIALDRAGLVPGDGETHQGIFDCAFISDIPNTEIYSPDSVEELEKCLKNALDSTCISAVRYPKGKPVNYDRSKFVSHTSYSVATFGEKNNDFIAFITYGRITADVSLAASRLCNDGYSVKIIKLLKVHPFDYYISSLISELSGASLVYFAEEGIKNGGISQKIISALAEKSAVSSKIHINAIDGIYPVHGSLDYIKKYCKLDADSIYDDVKNLI